MQFPVTVSNTTEVTGLGVEVCMTIPANESSRNQPEGKTFLISNRFEQAQNWGTPGEELAPTVTVEDFFNTTQRDASNYTWFTAQFTGTKNDTTNLTTWCLSSDKFNNFFSMAQTPNATNFNFYVNVIMNDLESNRSMCQGNETMISSVEFCGLKKDLTGCKMNTHVPTLSFTAGSTEKSGTNWLLWGGVAAGVVVVGVVVVVMMKGKGGDDAYMNQDQE